MPLPWRLAPLAGVEPGVRARRGLEGWWQMVEHVEESLEQRPVFGDEPQLGEHRTLAEKAFISLHQAIFQDAGFRAGEFDTGFMERFLASKSETEN